MSEDYFMEMLTATAPQMVHFLHTLSNILTGISRIKASILSCNALIEAGLFVYASAPQKIVERRQIL